MLASFGGEQVTAGSPASGTTATSKTSSGSDGDERVPDRRQAAGDSTPRRLSDTVVRVDEERLDLLLDTIGELVIAEAMVSESARTDLDTWLALGEKFSRLDKITRELQEMATSLRMVPLKGTFGRMARLVRDLSQKADKQVDLLLEGEDTELDKAMVDLIYDPLVHLVRNAMDHGLEAAEDRIAADKAPKGRLTLRAYHAGGSVCVEVEDDGRGLNSDVILEKARKQGLIAKDALLSQRDALDLVFLPGLSTASEITDISGRGVGMDVVKRAAEGLRGTVDVSTTPGQGTRFTLRLPLTLAIIDGMVLSVGSERYVLPTLVIQRSLRPAAGDVSTVLGRGEVLATSEGMVPLVRLARLFDVPEADVDPTEGIVVLVGENGARAGLVASEIIGQQQTVIKPLGDGVGNTPGVSGGAIMPDGNVGLILDVSGLVRLAHSEGGE
jgi:two-component system chemotaxis sensor kinase CheA